MRRGAALTEKTLTKDDLCGYRSLRIRAQTRLDRAEMWKKYVDKYGCGTEICAELIEEARALISKADSVISELEHTDICEQYKTFLYLRFIVGLTIPAIMQKMNFTRRWTQTIQSRALQALKEKR